VNVRITLILTVLIVIGTVTAAFAAGGDSRGHDSRSVVAAFYPLAYAAEQLAGPAARVTNLTPAGAEPHDLELSPDDVATLTLAGVVLLMGHGFQPQLERVAPHAARLLDTPGLRRVGNDPHVWLDPVRYATLVRAIGRQLHRDPAPLVARLQTLDREYAAGLAHCVRRDVVTNHAAFGYLARRYGLRQISVEGLSPEAEPTPQALARVVAAVRRTGARTVFTETLASPKVARTVARETGARTARLDPLEGLTPDALARGENYFTAMRSNLRALEEGLGCR
jgi:zinc transport system substrate-binding protein